MRVAKVYIEYGNLAVDRSFYYACGNHDVVRGMRVEVEFAYKQIVGFVYEIITLSDVEVKELPYEIKPILRVIDEVPLMSEELFALAFFMAKRYVAPFISCAQAMLPSKLKPKSANHRIVMETWVVFDKWVTLRTEKQKEALVLLDEKKEMRRSEFCKQYASQLTSLLKYEAIHLETREKCAFSSGVYEDVKVTLNEDQKKAIMMMQEKRGHHVYLLHGVTGSGKSEVFLQMAEKTLREGKQVLLLVPEIGLTPQMVKRVKGRFQEEVAIYHSSLNNQEKYEQYQLVREGKVNLVVGTRSAVFMPFQKLGLIVMDEEHDASYKQDSTPKYHTRDIAIERGRYHDCPVVLASATPSLESYARAVKQVYTLVEMPHRIHGEMPPITLVDMQKAMRNGENYILSDVLKKEIQSRLDRKEQVMLLLNRRGYAPVLRCMDCGDVVMCPHCDLALNYHKNTNMLKCHVCGYQEPKRYGCKKCGSQNVKYIGMGTQKLEEYVASCFPDAAIVRMDADTTSRKNAHETLLDKFEKEGDILLGTQMIAKGLDYERVTLVGILNGDALLSRSDYRSVELTFDLLVQASGRSGRGSKQGDVFIQVYDISHYAITCAAKHDYKQFFVKEMQYRHLGNYPPYSYLACITLLHAKEEVVQEEMQRIAEYVKDKARVVLGPISLLKKMDQYRMRIIIKDKEEATLAKLVQEAYALHTQSKGRSKMEWDCNPYVLE